MPEVRILTVRQPWAWAIIHGGKDVENRSRNIAGNYRGPVAIHAAKADDPDAWKGLARTDLAAWGRAMESPLSLVGGAILGVVDLAKVHHPQDRWGCPPSPGDLLPMCSPWAERDAYHLVLTNPRPLADPIPYRGALGLRRLDHETTARILAQIGVPLAV